MPQSLWSETKKHVVKVGKLECEVVLKHIGCGNPPRLFLFRKMADEWKAKNAKHGKDARIALMQEHGTADAAIREICGTPGPDRPPYTMDLAIHIWLQSQPAWLEDYSAYIQGMVVEGTVGGMEDLTRLYNTGGDVMLINACLAVDEFNKMDPSQGED